MYISSGSDQPWLAWMGGGTLVTGVGFLLPGARAPWIVLCLIPIEQLTGRERGGGMAWGENSRLSCVGIKFPTTC